VLDTSTPAAETLELLEISASVVSVIELVTVEPACDDDVPPAPPADTAVIVALEVASTWSAPGVVTVELLMYASVAFVIALVASAFPTPDPSDESPVAIVNCPAPTLIVELSVLDTLTLPAEMFWLPVM